MNLITQAVTYARQILANQPDRVAVRCVLFNHKKTAAAIAEIDRAGGYATHLYDLTDPVGCRRSSLLLACMYCSSVDAHGYDRRIRWERNGKQLTSLRVFVKGEWFGVKNILCDRLGLWGRCTKALALVRGQVAFSGYNAVDDSEKGKAAEKKVSICAILLSSLADGNLSRVLRHEQSSVFARDFRQAILFHHFSLLTSECRLC